MLLMKHKPCYFFLSFSHFFINSRTKDCEDEEWSGLMLSQLNDYLSVLLSSNIDSDQKITIPFDNQTHQQPDCKYCYLPTLFHLPLSTSAMCCLSQMASAR